MKWNKYGNKKPSKYKKNNSKFKISQKYKNNCNKDNLN